MGYDIADYEDIDPSYGTLADVNNLIQELKKRGMKLVMDLVVNHTSNQVSFGKFHKLSCSLHSLSPFPICQPATFGSGNGIPTSPSSQSPT